MANAISTQWLERKAFQLHYPTEWALYVQDGDWKKYGNVEKQSTKIAVSYYTVKTFRIDPSEPHPSFGVSVTDSPALSPKLSS